MEVITVTKTISARAYIVSPNEARVEITQSIRIQQGHTNLPTVSVSQEDLEEFKLAYKEAYGVDLDDRTALAKAGKALLLLSATYFPIPVSEANKLK